MSIDHIIHLINQADITMDNLSVGELNLLKEVIYKNLVDNGNMGFKDFVKPSIHISPERVVILLNGPLKDEGTSRSIPLIVFEKHWPGVLKSDDDITALLEAIKSWVSEVEKLRSERLTRPIKMSEMMGMDKYKYMHTMATLGRLHMFREQIIGIMKGTLNAKDCWDDLTKEIEDLNDEKDRLVPLIHNCS